MKVFPDKKKESAWCLLLICNAVFVYYTCKAAYLKAYVHTEAT